MHLFRLGFPAASRRFLFDCRDASVHSARGRSIGYREERTGMTGRTRFFLIFLRSCIISSEETVTLLPSRRFRCDRSRDRFVFEATRQLRFTELTSVPYLRRMLLPLFDSYLVFSVRWRLAFFDFWFSASLRHSFAFSSLRLRINWLLSPSFSDDQAEVRFRRSMVETYVMITEISGADVSTAET